MGSKTRRTSQKEAQEAQEIPNKINPNRPTLVHIIIKMAKIKNRDPKSSNRKAKSRKLKNSHKTMANIFLQIFYYPEGNVMIYTKC